MINFNNNLKELKDNNINPFSVPEGYFETFPTKMQERISSNQKEQIWVLKVLQYVKPQFALGLIIIIFAVISITTIDFILSNRDKASMSTDFYTRIIEVDASEFSEQHFIDILFEDENNLLKKKEIETDNYINYLINEDIDYRILIDGL